jgi:hypothetical protein
LYRSNLNFVSTLCGAKNALYFLSRNWWALLRVAATT